MTAADDLLREVGGRKFATVLADPPWRFHNRTGKMAPEHRRLARYPTLSFQEIENLPVGSILTATAHLYLWVPNALLPQGLRVMSRWGFDYKTNIVWYKVRKDGGPDRRGILLSQRHRSDPVRRPWPQRPHLAAWTQPSEHHRFTQARAQQKAGRAVRPRRVVQPGAIRRAVRPRAAAGMVRVGEPSGRIRPRLGHLRQRLAIQWRFQTQIDSIWGIASETSQMPLT